MDWYDFGMILAIFGVLWVWVYVLGELGKP